MPAAHCVSTVCGTILAVDQGFINLMRRPEQELLGTSYRMITDPRDLDKSAAMLSALVTKAAPIRLQKRYLLPDGATISANVLVTRFSDPDRLVSTLYLNDGQRSLPPAQLWEAALHARHVSEVRRDQLGPDLFNDGLNRLLIEVYLAEAEGRAVSQSQAAAESYMSLSTTNRWIRVLQERGMFSPGSTTDDITYSHSGIEKMETILRSIARFSLDVSDPN